MQQLARTARLREHGPSRLADDQHARPSCAAEATSRLGCTVWLVDGSGWLQLSQRTIVIAVNRSGADASQLTVACLRPALIALVVGLARLGDGPACCRANLVESMCARLSVSSTECVMIVVEVGAHAPTSHPSQSPSGTSTSTASQPVAGQNLEDPASWSKLTATCVWADTGGAGSTELSPTCLYRPAKGARCCQCDTGACKTCPKRKVATTRNFGPNSSR